MRLSSKKASQPTSAASVNAASDPYRSGISEERCNSRGGISFVPTYGLESDVGTSDSEARKKKRRLSNHLKCSPSQILKEQGVPIPSLHLADYFMQPSLEDLATRELKDPGYLSRVQNFTVGRTGYGYVTFLGETDLRGLALSNIVKFNRHEIVVYEDESAKPDIGQGLNKASEVTLYLQIRLSSSDQGKVKNIEEKLNQCTEKLGASFISYDCATGEWKFSVQHFSRFGLSEDDEDLMMDDARVQENVEVYGGDVSNTVADGEVQMHDAGRELTHSLPAHLGLDPVKMREMRMLMFPEEGREDFVHEHSRQKSSFSKENVRNPMQNSTQRSFRASPPVERKIPLPLLEYNSSSAEIGSPQNILMAQQSKTMPLKVQRPRGFELDVDCETPIAGYHSHSIVDAALFMGRSFRVGWGPNGVLVHAGAAVGSTDSNRVLSSVIHLEKVAIDKAVRDEDNKVKNELVELAFHASLSLHREIEHEVKQIRVGPFEMRLQRLVTDRIRLSEICRKYVDIIERQLQVPGLSSSAHLVLMHQVMVWELIKVLFSERENSGQSKSSSVDNEEEMMEDVKDNVPEVEAEALPLVRRAEFSYWLQEYVGHRVEADISSLSGSNYLEHLFLLLTGRQLDAAVELAASKGDVRLACLLSQAGGSMVNRHDISLQLDIWRNNGLDFNFIEKDRIRIFELLAGNIPKALQNVEIDWKRFLGLLMWHELPPNTLLPQIFKRYQSLLNDGRAPYPHPVYIDEGPMEDLLNWSVKECFDLSYYLMLLHANQGNEISFLKRMLSSSSSTHDPLDHHMIWHQRQLLEAVGAISSNDLHVLDMGLISQLLCLGQCHWAIYVVLHMPLREDYPYLQATAVREILFQYCENWSSDESQRQFIEHLGVPAPWLHEALAVYHDYYGDVLKSLEHFLGCFNWQKAHSIFVMSVAHSFFLSEKHSDIWRLVTLMEDHKSEIDNWDLGAGIYISFYSLKSSLVDNESSMNELESLEERNEACKHFLDRLNHSIQVWGDRLQLETRVAYSKMAEEVSNLLISDIARGSSREVQLSCFQTVCNGPVPEDLRAVHLQDAVSLFTCYLSELAS